MWQHLGLTFGLMLVVEGLLPFIQPARWRNMVSKIAALDDRTLRTAGLVAMLGGCAILYLLN